MDPNAPATATPSTTPVTPFLTTVGAPLMWIGIGYLLATLMQRPRRGGAAA